MTRSFRAHIWIAGAALATAKTGRGCVHAAALSAGCAPSASPRNRTHDRRRTTSAHRSCALAREQAPRGRDAAVGGEAAGLAAGREHAMAWHDERERVSPERLSDVAREAAFAEPRRDLPV